MGDAEWIKAIRHWRQLPLEERRRRHLEAIPQRIVDSMAMAGEPVDEARVRARLAALIPQYAMPKSDSVP